MSGISDEEFETMLADVDEAAERAASALDGRFSEIYRQLRGLSPEEINDITPGASDQKEYERLLALVQQATTRNMTQAELATRIRQLGDTALKIAKKSQILVGLL
tara:strand:- start:13695 stop:14009 length:315 start_codon:yes stop_codon:yes gene_type:complete